mgnify:CR=1 FL=1
MFVRLKLEKLPNAALQLQHFTSIQISETSFINSLHNSLTAV